MRVLFDQGTPAPLRVFLIGHEVVTAFERGWSEISNGDLLANAEKEFNVLVTTTNSSRTNNTSRAAGSHSGFALRKLDQVADACREDRKRCNSDAAGQL